MSRTALARTNVEKKIVDMAVFQGVYKCYKNGYVNSTISPLSGGSLINSDKASANDYVPLVTDIRAESALNGLSRYRKDGLSCNELFNGSTETASLLKAFNKTEPNSNNSEAMIQFYENMGYSVSNIRNNASGDICYNLSYTWNAQSKWTNYVCQGTDGKLYTEGDESEVYFIVEDGNKIKIHILGSSTLPKSVEFDTSGSLNSDWLNYAVGEICGSSECRAGTIRVEFSRSSSEQSSTDGLGNKKASFIEKNAEEAALRAIRYLSSDNSYASYDSIKIKPLVKRILYQDYLESFYDVKVVCVEGAAGTPIRWFDKSTKTMKDCRYSINSNRNYSKPVNGVNSEGLFEYKSIGDRNGLIGAINELAQDYSEEEIAEIEGVLNSEIEGASIPESDAECFNGSGALGWILCPVVTALSGVGEHMWEQIEVNHLQMPAQEIFGNNSGVENAWNMMRNIANIVFIILFLFVIFSQLTGYGIDNYGIKKILPKLIIVAVLINLSYFICELAVDLSNIFGNGINNMLEGMAPPIDGRAEEMGLVSQSTGFLAAGALAGGGVALYGFLMSWTLPLAGAAIGIAAFGFIITIVVAMLTLYLVLIIRDAGIVLLIVLAPVAIVCYLLPNTEKFYKKWFDLLKALLIVYPICGFMVGGGKLAGNILATIDNESMITAAMLVQVLPYFFIPQLLQNSLALLGNIGAKVSSLGKSLGGKASRGATGAIRNSEQFKGFQQRQKAFGEERRANRIMNRLRGRDWDSLTKDEQKARRESLSENLQRKLLEAERRVAQGVNESAAAREGVYVVGDKIASSRARQSVDAQERKAYDDMYAGDGKDALRDEAKNAYTWINGAGGQQRAAALFSAMDGRGMHTEMADAIKALETNGVDVSRNIPLMQTLANSSSKIFKAFGKVAEGTGVTYKAFMDGTGEIEVDDGAGGTKKLAVTLQKYVEDKGVEYLNGLDDKAVKEIIASGAGDKIISSGLLVEGLASINEQSTVEQLEKLMASRTDIRFSGKQLSKFNGSTVRELVKMAKTNSNIAGQIIKASNDIVTDTSLLTGLDDSVRAEINKYRASQTPPLPPI